jgi:hypothetical protein
MRVFSSGGGGGAGWDGLDDPGLHDSWIVITRAIRKEVERRLILSWQNLVFAHGPKSD